MVVMMSIDPLMDVGVVNGGRFWTQLMLEIQITLHSNLPNIMPAATKVHVMLRRFASVNLDAW